jgi:hypothetical protein
MRRNPAIRPLSPAAMRPALLLAMLLGCTARGAGAKYPTTPRSVLQTLPAWQEDVVVEVRNAPAAPLRRAFALSTGQLFGGQSSGPPTAQVVPAPKQAEKLVIEAWLELRVDDVAAAAAAIRARVEAEGGRVVSENVIGPDRAASSAALELRVLPERATEFQSWLGSRGVIEARRVLASDVSKTLFDQELALQNLELTMTRLQALVQQDVPMKDLLEIEKEMTRVRGDIERIKGEHRWLLDRVAYATITLTLRREGGPIEFAPHARIHPGAHLATLTLLDPDGRTRSRIGGGVTIHVQRYLTFDLDAFPAEGDDSRAVIGTVGGALYSSFLGGGRRRWGNPFLGARLGYGYLSGEQCGIAGGEIGLELYKHRYLQIEAAMRAIAFFRDDRTDVALHGQLGLAVPF